MAPVSDVVDKMALRIVRMRKRWLDAGDMIVMIRCGDPGAQKEFAKHMAESLNAAEDQDE
jgi:hypothetical protein